MNRIVTVLMLIVALLGPTLGWARVPGIKNIILLIPDGLSIEGTTLARWMQDGRPLAWDPYICGLVRTYAADVPITDSAPAATAYATAYKSHTGFIAVLPDESTMPGQSPIVPGEERSPKLTILEAAHLLGKSTGLVVTSEVQHATPAAFSSHTASRKAMEDIAEQQVYGGLKVVLGGGGKYFNSQDRQDKQDLWRVLESKGYKIVRNPPDFKKVNFGKMWGIFDDLALTCDLSRNPDVEPSLAEMTDKAIELLSQNKTGFFLLVEGSQIDWAGHGNDPVGYMADTLAFNQAVERALAFAKGDGQTVVIVVADHGTGGISMGNHACNNGYDKKPLNDFMAPLKRAKISAYELEKDLIKEIPPEQVIRQLAERYGLEDLSAAETSDIFDYLDAVRKGDRKKGTLDKIIGPMLSLRAFIGWTTTGHVGGDVALAIYHPQGDRPSGVIDNTDVNRYMQRLFGVDLQALTKRYFIKAEPAFTARGASVRLDESDPAKPVLQVSKGSRHMQIPANQNFVILDGQKIEFATVNVYNGRNFFVSQELLHLLD